LIFSDELKCAIKNDIDQANTALDLFEKITNFVYKSHDFFTSEMNIKQETASTTHDYGNGEMKIKL